MSAPPAPFDRREHWENVYRTRKDAELSWFQDRPERSLEIIARLGPNVRRAIDIGGGQSVLAGELLARGVDSVTVLDVSGAALERARARLGDGACMPRWVQADVVAEPPPALEAVDLWHDRAVFHFLTDAADRARYVRLAAATVVPGGHALIATFAPTGPDRCSGLNVRRCSAADLEVEFAPAFTLALSSAETHRTPWGKPQDFVYTLLRRTGAATS